MDEKEISMMIEDAETDKGLVINSESLIALARLIASLGVSVFAVIGWSIDFNLVYNILLSVLAVGCIAWGLWWKNNNVTRPAQMAQDILDAIKHSGNDEAVEDIESDAEVTE